MAVDANLAYTLARESGFGVELCKYALERSKNDVESAVKLLKRWNGSKATNDSIKKFGATCTYFESQHDTATAVKVTCSDELFAKSRKFYELVGQIADELVQWDAPYVADAEIEQIKKEHDFQITVESARFVRSNPLCLLTTYTHKDNIAVVLETEVANEQSFNNRQFRLFSFDLAMHIAAFNPVAVTKDGIPANLKQERQLEIERQLAKEGKEMMHWLVASEGKMNKWAEQHTLLTQIFIKDDKDTVDELRKKVGEKIGSNINITRFARFAI